MYKLRDFDPTTTNIQHLRFAVRVPDGINIPKNAVQLLLGTERQTRVSLKDTFYLERIDDRTALLSIEREKTALHVYGIAPVDVKRFNRLRRAILHEKARGAVGSLEINTDVCRLSPVFPARIFISTFVSAKETEGYVALMLNIDMLKKIDLSAAQDLVPICSDY